MFGYRQRRIERTLEAHRRDMHTQLDRHARIAETRTAWGAEPPPKTVELYHQQGYTTPEGHAGTFRRIDTHAELDDHMAGDSWVTARWHGHTYIRVGDPDQAKLGWLHDPDTRPDDTRTGWIGC